MMQEDSPNDIGKLLIRIGQRDRKAFVELHAKFDETARCWIRRKVRGDSNWHDETAQDFWQRVWTSAHNFDTINPKAWLNTLLTRACTATIKRIKGRVTTTDADDADKIPIPAPDPSALIRLVNDEEKAMLKVAIEELPPSYRHVIYLRLQGEKWDDIATDLETSRTNAFILHSRALESLRQRFREKNRGLY